VYVAFLFDVAGEKELSIPMILGGILFLLTRSPSILIAVLVYTSLAGILESYSNALKSQIGKEQVDGDRFIEGMWLLLENRLDTGSNIELRCFRGLMVSSIAMILTCSYLLYESVLFVTGSSLSSGLALVFYIGIIYSFYLVYSSFFSMPLYLIVDKALAVLFPSSEDKEELSNFSFNTRQED
jgi:hypothetical protein